MIYQVMTEFENDPDHGTGNKPPEKGMWVWWRTGPHPMGHWMAVDFDREFSAAYYANEKAFPIMQDKALGESGDWGNRSCHACGNASEGYPEPRHNTICDGICKRPSCELHGESGKQNALEQLREAYQLCLYRDLTFQDAVRYLIDVDNEEAAK